MTGKETEGMRQWETQSRKERGEAGKRKRVRRWEIRTEAEIESD